MLVLIAALFAVQAEAAIRPEAGNTYYLYNVGQQKYLSAADDGTLTLGGARIAVTLAKVAKNGSVDEGYYTLTTAKGKICSSLLAAPRCDGSVPYDQWAIEEVSGKSGNYTIANRYRDAGAHHYMYYSTLFGTLFTEPLKPWASFENAQWQFIGEDEIPTEDVFLNQDATGYTAPTAAKADVYLYRTLTLGQFNSFCVPFDISAEQLKEQFGDDVQLIEFTGVSGNTIYFKTVTEEGVKAGKPYHLKPSKEAAADYQGTKCYKFTGVTSFASDPEAVTHTDAADGKQLTFTTTFFKSTAPAGAYVIRKGEVYHLVSDMAIKGFRGYFTLSGADKASISNFTVDGEATGIGAVTADGGQQFDIYNTAGQQVRHGATSTDGLQKGVYVVKGKKSFKK